MICKELIEQKGKIAVLVCCAPCCCSVAQLLAREGVDATFIFYNPNIFPMREYEKRKAEVARICEKFGIQMVSLDYEPWVFDRAAKGLESEPERGARCGACFALRLRRTAAWAKANGCEAFTSTLAFSRWKCARLATKAGGTASKTSGLKYLDIDWRMGDTLPAHSREIIKELGIYEQRYCGCRFSYK